MELVSWLVVRNEPANDMMVFHKQYLHT